MGYTHYYSWAPEHPEFVAQFGRLVVDAKRIAAESGVALGNYIGEGEPEFEEGFISFNGSAAAGEDYETFIILGAPPLNPEGTELYTPGQAASYAQERYLWSGCKTGQRPYDLVVTAVLLRARQLMPNSFAVSSDGAFDDDWLPARALVQRLFGDTHGGLVRSIDGPPCMRVPA